jgi:hypothetical protein
MFQFGDAREGNPLPMMQRGLVEDPGGADRAYKRGKTVRSKPRPFLGFEIEEADVDMARCLKLHATAQSIDKVARGIWIGETTLLQTKVTDAKERLWIYFEPLMSNDIAWTEQVSVFTDIGGGPNRVVNLRFTSEMLSEIKIAVECQALNVLLTEVGIQIESADTSLDLTYA